MTEHPEHNQPPEQDEQAERVPGTQGTGPGTGGSPTLSRLAERLEASTLAESARELIREALDGAGPAPTRPSARTRTTGCSWNPSASAAFAVSAARRICRWARSRCHPRGGA
ncbi:hypothetical protein SFUMM280S_08382 [Streptomyces fumanus]